jgi:hypothetical protein
MAKTSQILQGLRILRQGGDLEIIARDNEILVEGCSKESLSPEDRETLKELDWHWSSYYHMWVLPARSRR